MANTKISELAAISALDDDDILVIVEDGTNKKVTVAELRTALVGTVADGTWTPAIVDDGGVLNYGSGATQSGRYLKMGRLVHLWGVIKFGTTSFNQGTGNWRLKDFPFDFSADMPSGTGFDIGMFDLGVASIWDDSAGSQKICTLHRWANELDRVVGTIDSVFLGANTPWTWGQTDQINFHVCYETDE